MNEENVKIFTSSENYEYIKNPSIEIVEKYVHFHLGRKHRI